MIELRLLLNVLFVRLFFFWVVTKQIITKFWEQ